MKIKTKIFIAMFSVMLVLSFATFIAHLGFDFYQQKNYVKYARGAIDDFCEWNNNVANLYLSPFSELYIEYTTKNLAKVITSYYKKNHNDHTKLSKEKELEKTILDSTYLDNIKVGYAAVLYKKKIILCSDAEDVGDNIKELLDKNTDIKKFAERMKTKKNVSGYYTYFPKNKKEPDYEYLSAYVIPNTPLVIVYSLSLRKYLTPMRKEKFQKIQTEKRKSITDTIYSYFIHEMIFTTFFSVTVLILTSILLVPLILKFADSITVPIRKLRLQATKLGKGCFNIAIAEKGSEEIKDLINSFNYLGKELEEYTADLAIEIKKREKIDTELSIAKKIQENSLPKVENEFKNENFILAAKLIPAEKVAGDFYDFFYIEKKLVVMIADVSGKGISAAFFMNMAKTQLHNLCYQYTDPKDVLQEANKVFRKNNQQCIFATVFIAFYDTKNGEMQYANAGHESVIKLEENGNLKELGLFEQPAVGLFQDSIYTSMVEKLNINDTLIFYTDGIIDAKSPKGDFYRESRFKNLLKKNSKLNPDQLANVITKKIVKFEHNILFDDIALVILKRTKKKTVNIQTKDCRNYE
jgi:serine phosphatase RsbU (regulator of sigma subunit)